LNNKYSKSIAAMKTFQQFMEQHPTMQPNEYNKQVARQSAKWKGMQSVNLTEKWSTKQALN
jgi:hypothetical protein